MLSVGWALVYVIVALISLPLVSKTGPVAITKYQIEELYDNGSGPVNVAYRILAPMLFILMILQLLSLLLSSLGWPQPESEWISVALYWVALGVLKVVRTSRVVSFAAFVIEAITSIAIALLFELFVLIPLHTEGIVVLDQSSFAFEIELALFYVVAQIASSLIIRKEYSVLYRSPGNGISGGQPCGCRSYKRGVDTSEKKLYEYRRKYADLLPSRFKADPLLNDLLFAIMAIEDYNRPATMRQLERIACLFGMAKTTGIMQQNGGKPLSDEESVILAATCVERMWDSFLLRYAQSSKGGFSKKTMVFADDWYRYDYEKLKDAIVEGFAFLYGDYCGTRLLECNSVISDVISFDERDRYGLLPKTVMAPGAVCAAEIRWLSGGVAYWSGSETIRVVDIEENASTVKIIRPDMSKREVDRTCLALKDRGVYVISVTFAEHTCAIVECDSSIEVSSFARNSGWRIIGEGLSQ